MIKTTIVSSLLIIGMMATVFVTEKQALAEDTTGSKILPEITVYKSATCGCCGKWVSHLESNGFTVNAINTDNLATIKQQLGIAPKLQSCHTAQIGNYFVEGHVPAADIKKMLATKADIKGIAVPGMPMGSPGMEGARKDNYDVLAVKKDNGIAVFNSH